MTDDGVPRHEQDAAHCDKPRRQTRSLIHARNDANLQTHGFAHAWQQGLARVLVADLCGLSAP